MTSIPLVIAAQFVEGFLDSLNFFYPLLFITFSGSIRKVLSISIIFNMLMYLGIKAASSFIVTLSGCDSFYHPLLLLSPLFLLSFLLNSIWYRDIAIRCFSFLGSHAELAIQEHERTWHYTHDLIKPFSVDGNRTIVLGVFFLQLCLFWYLPFIGVYLSNVYFCFLYSFFSFEYRLIFEKKGFDERIRILEENWGYYLGFGALYTGASSLGTNLYDGPVISLLFYLLVMQSFVHKSFPEKHRCVRLPIFKLSRVTSLLIFKYFKIKTS